MAALVKLSYRFQNYFSKSEKKELQNCQPNYTYIFISNIMCTPSMTLFQNYPAEKKEKGERGEINTQRKEEGKRRRENDGDKEHVALG
jgi:hypothetical protein